MSFSMASGWLPRRWLACKASNLISSINWVRSLASLQNWGPTWSQCLTFSPMHKNRRGQQILYYFFPEYPRPPPHKPANAATLMFQKNGSFACEQLKDCLVHHWGILNLVQTKQTTPDPIQLNPAVCLVCVASCSRLDQIGHCQPDCKGSLVWLC